MCDSRVPTDTTPTSWFKPLGCHRVADKANFSFHSRSNIEPLPPNLCGNVQGTGSGRYHFADDYGSAASCSTCRRPSTAPAGQYPSAPLVARGSTSLATYGNTSDIIRGRAIGAGRRPREDRPLPLGPIPLNEGRKLRYPLLQLKRERARAESACGTRSVGGDAKDRGRNSAHQVSYVDVPVTRNWKGRWQPHLARVPCSRITPDQG